MMTLYRAVCAFRERVGDAVVAEASAPDQVIDVSDDIAPALLASGHIAVIPPKPAYTEVRGFWQRWVNADGDVMTAVAEPGAQDGVYIGPQPRPV
jgi:hypothetical protein